MPALIWFAPLLSRSVYKGMGQQIGPILVGALLVAAVAVCRQYPNPVRAAKPASIAA
jgi:hypothetical protein